MDARRPRWAMLALVFAIAGAVAPRARADVVVSVIGNTATATISLDGPGGRYTADVTIAFDTALDLSAESLNLTAELVDPNDPALRARFPGGLVGGVSVDPDFPVLVSVEPTALDHVFVSSYEPGEDGAGTLSFRNTYAIEVHTHDLVYQPNTDFRLFKAPHDGAFDDVSSEIASGSVRARGRGGAFSQFLVVHDTRASLLVALGKIVALDARILASALSDGLRLDLIGLLTQVQSALLVLDITGAIASLDQLIAEIDAHAGIDIANLWRAQRDVANDAGEMSSLAQTLRFTLVRLQGGG